MPATKSGQVARFSNFGGWHLFLRQDEGTFDESLRGISTAEKEERLRQKKLVESFIREEFHDSQTGTNLRAYHTYHRPQSFSERLRVHLQEVLDGLTGADIGRPAWEIDERGPPLSRPRKLSV